MSTKPIQLALLFLMVLAGDARAQVELDGSLGPGPAGPVGSGFDPNGDFADYLISADLGQPMGSNLFQSFLDFSVPLGEVAAFTETGWTGAVPIGNVFGRVTGGNPSDLLGTLRSTIPNADVFLLNPSGIMFGQNAELDVQGSFSASTADFVRFDDNAAWPTGVATNGGLLTAAAPSKFGFTSAEPAGITVDKSFMAGPPQFQLEVPEGETLSLVGGDVTIGGGGPAISLRAPGGTVQIASAAGAVEIPIDVASFAVGSVAPDVLGSILITNDAEIRADGSGTVTGAGGRVVIRGGQLLMDGASGIQADTFFGVDGAPRAVDIEVAGSAVITGNSSISVTSRGLAGTTGRAGDIYVGAESFRLGAGSQILNFSQFFGSGEPGDIFIAAEQIDVDAGATIGLAVPPNPFVRHRGGNIELSDGDDIGLSDADIRIAGLVRSAAGNPGDGGLIDIHGANIEVTGRVASASVLGAPGAGGNVEITASQSLVVDGGSVEATAGDGPGGNVILDAPRMRIVNGGSVGVETVAGGGGVSGSIDLTAHESLEIDGLLSSVSAVGRNTPGGSISVHAGAMSVTNSGLMTVSAEGTANAGSIDLDVRTLRIDGIDEFGNRSAITAQSISTATGNAGNITIDASESVAIFNGGQISVASVASTSGATGSIFITTDFLVMEHTEDGIRATSFSNNDAGDITIRAGDTVELVDASISSETLLENSPAAGGNITIIADDLISLQLGSRIEANVVGPSGGGNVELTAPNVAVNRSDVVANAPFGTGGNIDINSAGFFVSGGNLREVSPGLVISGSDLREVAPGVFVQVSGGDLREVLPDVLFLSDGSSFDVSGGFASGQFVSRAPDTAVVASVAALSEDFLDVSDLIANQCAAREAPIGSLVVRGRDRVPAAPDDELRILFGGAD